MNAPIRSLALPVHHVMSDPPPVMDRAASCAAAVTQMAASDTSCILIHDTAGGITGIITEQDVTRRIAFRSQPDTPLSDVMTSPVQSVRDSDRLYQAIGQMRRHGLRHIPVTGADGQVVGLLHLRHALADASGHIVSLIDRLTVDATPDRLATIKQVQTSIVGSMLDAGIPVPDILSLITDINHDIHRQIIEQSLRAMEEKGHGTPPVPFTAIVMGSGGRGENFLYPDQDNGFVIADYADSEHTRIDRYFIELAEQMNNALDLAGFPLCKGGVMAINPVWRKTTSQWRTQTSGWARRRSITTVRLADIFFDFQPVWGDPAAARDLRRHITTLMTNNLAFLQEINRDQREFGTAIGLFGRLRTERQPGPTRGLIDVKRGGLLPLINGVRILCLRDGIAVTPTLARIAALAEINSLTRDEADDLMAAFQHIASLLLRRQIDCQQAGLPVTNGLPPGGMTRREKRQLKEGLKAIDRLRDRVNGEITGDILTGGGGARPG